MNDVMFPIGMLIGLMLFLLTLLYVVWIVK
jgi:hypothetical protein